MTTLFPTHQQFEHACHAFIDQHQSPGNAALTDTVNSFRTQSGWKWQDNPVHPHNGYMSRTDLKMVQPHNKPPDAFPIDEMQESEEDPAVSHVGNTNASSYIEVEWNVVYSRTYRIPQLCFNVSDSTGSPLSLSELVASGIILQQPPDSHQIHDEHLDLPSNMDIESPSMDSAFPLLQKIHHPYPRTGGDPNFVETVWSIHPCHVQDTITEILSSNETDRLPVSPSKGASRKASHIGEPRTPAPSSDNQAIQLQKQLLWLDCWFMVTSTLLNLRR